MTGAELIAVARAKQAAKGFDAAHDDAHGVGVLCLAGALLAAWERLFSLNESANALHFEDAWPFNDYDPRPFNGNVVQHNRALTHAERIDQLAIAGAFIAAEIDLLQRIPAKDFNRYRSASGTQERDHERLLRPSRQSADFRRMGQEFRDAPRSATGRLNGLAEWPMGEHRLVGPESSLWCWPAAHFRDDGLRERQSGEWRIGPRVLQHRSRSSCWA